MKRWVIGAIGIATALALSSACDSTATISYKNVKVEAVRVVSAAPLVQDGEGTARSCQVGAADEIVGFDIALTVKGTAFDEKQTCGNRIDQDQAVRPGDRIERVMVVPGDNFSPESFELDLSCVEPYPDADGAACGGVGNPSVDLTGLSWVANHEEGYDPVRCEPAAIAVLVDQSGSMAGFVNAELDYQEDVQGEFVWPSDDERQAVASDPQRHRIGAVQDLIAKLNANDKLVVFSYQEKNEDTDLQVLCEGTAAPDQGDLLGKEEYFRKAYNCFGTNRAVIEAAVALAYGDEEGRTPLWTSLLKAYKFLQDPVVDAPSNRHIVVIGDGPDTCNVASDEFVTDKPQCAEDSYEEVRTYILENNDLVGSHPVHIHFVQIQAYGYRDRDPRQQELACLTGGHHLFVNSFDMPRTQGSTVELAEALKDAVARIRYSFSGNWHMKVETPAFQVAEGNLGYLDPGFLYGITGNLALLAETGFTNLNKEHEFNASGGDLTGYWDQRLAFRRACDSDAQCAGISVGDSTNDCIRATAICSPQTLTCGGEPEPLDDGTACETTQGLDGVCVSGECFRTCESDEDCSCTQECDGGACEALGGTGSRGVGAGCSDGTGAAGTCDESDVCVTGA